MIRNDYAVVPVEFHSREAQTEARDRASALYPAGNPFEGGGSGSAERGLDAVYSIAGEYEVEAVGSFAVWLAFVGTAAVFVFHRSTSVNPDADGEERSREIVSALRDRRNLHDHLLGQAQSAIVTSLGRLAADLPHEPHSYVFSYFVFEDMTHDQFLAWDTHLKLLSEPSRLGLEADEGNEDGESVREAVTELEVTMEYSIADSDISHYSCAYVTWASIASASWGNAAQSARTKNLILGLEIKLQAAWNKSDALSQRINAIIRDEEDVDGDAILVGFSQALESIRGVVSTTIPSREQAFFDALRSTSRIDEQIDLVERRLLLMERYVDRRRELARRRLERFAKVALYVIGAADVLGTVLSLLVGDLPPLLRITWFLGGLTIAIACGLGLWWFWEHRAEGARSATPT